MKHVKRLDKKVECQDCYHVFWSDKHIPLKLTWCTYCNSLNLRLLRENGKPVYQVRDYTMNDKGE